MDRSLIHQTRAYGEYFRKIISREGRAEGGPMVDAVQYNRFRADLERFKAKLKQENIQKKLMEVLSEIPGVVQHQESRQYEDQDMASVFSMARVLLLLIS